MMNNFLGGADNSQNGSMMDNNNVQSMFDMFSNMMKMMMLQQQQQNSQSNLLQNNPNNYNSAMMSNFLSQQSQGNNQPLLIPSTRVVQPNNIEAPFQNYEDRFNANNQQTDILLFEDQSSRKNSQSSPISQKTSTQFVDRKGKDYFESGKNIMSIQKSNQKERLKSNHNNNTNNLLETSATSELLPSKSDFLQYDFQQSDLFHSSANQQQQPNKNVRDEFKNINNYAIKQDHKYINYVNDSPQYNNQHFSFSSHNSATIQNPALPYDRRDEQMMNEVNPIQSSKKDKNIFSRQQKQQKQQVQDEYPQFSASKRDLQFDSFSQKDSPNKIKSDYQSSKQYSPFGKGNNHHFEGEEEEDSDEMVQFKLHELKANTTQQAIAEKQQVHKHQPQQQFEQDAFNSQNQQIVRNNFQVKKQGNDLEYDEIPIKSQKSKELNSNDNRFIKPMTSKQSQMTDEDRLIANNSGIINPFEEIPIKSSGIARRFEDLIEEKMREEGQDYDNDIYYGRESQEHGRFGRKKNFLKKGTRSFLSNAQQRSQAAQNHIDSINDQQQENKGSQQQSQQKQKQLNLNRSKSYNISTTQKAQNSKVSQNQSQVSDSINSNGLSNQNTFSNVQDSSAHQQKKSFLQRGKGKGGGISNTSTQNEIKKPEGDLPIKLTDKSVVIDNEQYSKQQQLKQKKIQIEVKNQQDLLSLGEDANNECQYSNKKEYQQPKYEPQKYMKVQSTVQNHEHVQSTQNSSPYQFYDEEEWVNSKKSKPEINLRNQKNDYEIDSEKEEEKYGEDEGERIQQQSKAVSNQFNRKAKSISQYNCSANQSNQIGVFTEEQKKQAASEYTSDQIEKLNCEIAKFKQENEKIKKTKCKYEDLLRALNKEKEHFEKQKEILVLEFEEWKKEEQNKIRQEKRIADRQQKAMANMPNRKEREEIEGYKQQIKKLTDEMKMKDQRNKLTLERAKKQFDEQAQKNQELLEEIKVLEKFRIDHTDSASAASSIGVPKSTYNKTNLIKNSLQCSSRKPSKSLISEYDYLSKKESQQDRKSQEISSGSALKKKPISRSNSIMLQDQKYDGSSSVSSKNPYSFKENKYKHYELFDNIEDDLEQFGNSKRESQYNSNSKYNHTEAEKEEVEQDYNDIGDTNNDNSQMDINQATFGRRASYKSDEDPDNNIKQNAIESYEDIINFNPNSDSKNRNTKHTTIVQEESSITQSISNKFHNQNNQQQHQKNNLKNSVITISNANNNNQSTPVNSNFNSNHNPFRKISNSFSISSQGKESKERKDIQQYFKYDICKLSQAKSLSISMINKEIDINQLNYDGNSFYQNHISQSSKPNKIISEQSEPDGKDGKILRIYEDGKREVLLSNKFKRQIYENGFNVINFVNKDIKQVIPGQISIYYFAEAETTQINFPNGINIYKFYNGQIEFHFPNGKKEIRFSDGTEKISYEDGVEKTFFPDGSIQTVDANRVKTIKKINRKEEVIEDE